MANNHQCTSSTISVVCLAKTLAASGDFLSAKMHSTEKSVFLDDFLQTREMMYLPYCVLSVCGKGLKSRLFGN